MNPETHEVVPGTGWFHLGDWKVFLNKSLISLLIAVAGATLGAVGETIANAMREAPLPTEIQGALYTITVWASASIYRAVFPQAPTIVKRK